MFIISIDMINKDPFFPGILPDMPENAGTNFPG